MYAKVGVVSRAVLNTNPVPEPLLLYYTNMTSYLVQTNKYLLTRKLLNRGKI